MRSVGRTGGGESDSNGQPAYERRTGARVIVRDRDGLVLLFCGIDPHAPEVRYWFTPGGGLDPGETFEEAAARELREETGFELTALLDVVREDEVEFPFEGVMYRQEQRFYAVEVPVSGPAIDIDLGGWTEDERRSVSRYRWWSLAELESTGESVHPADLAALVRSVRRWGSASPR
ncbi:MAG TPA: NUDIX domain-containing protein [Acidimicrobiales bacterium]|nr:NUDIX domain-containing protein [Acidimicrobiales bacterium]